MRSYLLSVRPNSKTDEEDFMRRSWENFTRQSDYLFGIETLIDNTLIGATGLHDVSWINRNAELGISIWNKAYHSKGYGTEAIQLLLFYAFEVLGLNSVQLNVYEYNTRAIKAYEKIGVQHVGRWRQGRYMYGKFHDVILMDILASEFRLPNELDTLLTKKYRFITQKPLNT